MINNKVQLITYPDSMGGSLHSLNNMLNTQLEGVFEGGVHILPPFPSSGDRGFAPKTYLEISPEFGTWQDIQRIGENRNVVVDVMVNHISKESEYFQDYLEKGAQSAYADFFITLDKLWPDGNPPKEDMDKIFLRRTRPYSEYLVHNTPTLVWTTFGQTEPSEQIDLDIHSPAVQKLFQDVFAQFGKNNISIVRLDAVGYVIKKPGTSCFFVEPDIYTFLNQIQAVANEYGITLLPEVHADITLQQKLVDRGYWIYDFILPYRMLEMLLCKTSAAMKEYLQKRPHRQFTMLDCHDGVPIKPDLDGMYNSELAKRVVAIAQKNGCNVSRILSEEHKDADGFDVHQICGTYYSMLEYNPAAYVAARAVQLFVPGIPQVYYVGLLAGENHPERLEATKDGREINRHNFTEEEILHCLKKPVVEQLCLLMRFRNSCECFNGTFFVDDCSDTQLILRWQKGADSCALHLDLQTYHLTITHKEKLVYDSALL